MSTFFFLGWIFILLEYHTRQYAAVRQHYLRGGDDPNYWRDLHLSEADGTHVRQGQRGMSGDGEGRSLLATPLLKEHTATWAAMISEPKREGEEPVRETQSSRERVVATGYSWIWSHMSALPVTGTCSKHQPPSSAAARHT